MPWGLKRYDGTGSLHFITCSCYRRQPFLSTPARRDLLLAVLERMRESYQFVVIGYVIMPEHFHLLMSEPQIENTSTVMQALKLSFARKLLRKQNPDYSRRVRSGCEGPSPPRVPHFSRTLREVGPLALDSNPNHIWTRRYYDFNVWSQRKEVEKLRYMHRNPVARGLVQVPEDWLWSSFRSYAYGEVGTVRINDWARWEEKIRQKIS
jgi:putative transposase